jgi:hypothetical protein
MKGYNLQHTHCNFLFFLLRIINLLRFPRRNQLIKKGTVVEPSTNPMNGSKV